MRKILITLAALALALTASAQPGNRPGGGRPVGGPGGGYGHSYTSGGSYRPRPGGYYMDDGTLEFGVSINYFNNARDYYRPSKLGFFGEYRVDVSPVVDLGVQLYTTFGKGSYSTNGEPYGPDFSFWQGVPLVVTDINLMPYSGFNPYVGIGIGPGFGWMKSEFADKGDWTQSLVLNPRAGIELFECLRMSIMYQWYLNDWARYSHFGLGISWAFGPGMGRGRRPRW